MFLILCLMQLFFTYEISQIHVEISHFASPTSIIPCIIDTFIYVRNIHTDSFLSKREDI